MPGEHADREAVVEAIVAQLRSVPFPLRVTIDGSYLHADWSVPAAAPVNGDSDSAPDINEIEAAALAAFQDEKERVTGENLSERTIYPYDSRFKDTLSRLRRIKCLVNHSPGYSRTPTGTAALSAYRLTRQETP